MKRLLVGSLLLFTCVSAWAGDAVSTVVTNGVTDISTRTFHLVHVDAAEVAEKFNATWSGDFGGGFKITKIAQAFTEANKVMVTAPGAVLDACEEVIREVDVPPQQVYIE